MNNIKINLDRHQIDLILQALKTHSHSLKQEQQDYLDDTIEMYEVEDEVEATSDLMNILYAELSNS